MPAGCSTAQMHRCLLRYPLARALAFQLPLLGSSLANKPRRLGPEPFFLPHPRFGKPSSFDASLGRLYITSHCNRRSKPQLLMCAKWLLKSEPETWSWDDQVKKKIEPWDGVRNHQAANNMKAMKAGDLAFFYHSGKERQVMGIVRVCREYYPDPSDKTGKFGMVDVETVEAVPRPVTLSAIKGDSRLSHIALVRQSRLSVTPVDEEAWDIIKELGFRASEDKEDTEGKEEKEAVEAVGVDGKGGIEDPQERKSNLAGKKQELEQFAHSEEAPKRRRKRK